MLFSYIVSNLTTHDAMDAEFLALAKASLSELELPKLVQQAARDLDAHGYAVIPSLASAALRTRWIDAYWETLGAMTNGAISRNDVQSHKKINNLKGIVQEPCELSHARFAWEVRVFCRVAFAHLYGDCHLATSIDRLCYYYRPDSANNMPERRAKGPWLHTDQSPLRKGRWWVQAFLDLLGTGELDGGLLVAAGTHQRHAAILNACGQGAVRDDWYKLTDVDRALCAQKKLISRELTKVVCPPGSLVLWDSRTLHQNTPPRYA